MPSEQEYIEAIADLNTLLAVRDQRIRELELQIIKANKLMQGEDNDLWLLRKLLKLKVLA